MLFMITDGRMNNLVKAEYNDKEGFCGVSSYEKGKIAVDGGLVPQKQNSEQKKACDLYCLLYAAFCSIVRAGSVPDDLLFRLLHGGRTGAS